MSALGIGIVTFNRLPLLKQVVGHIIAHTVTDYCLVIGNDGSTDETYNWGKHNDLITIGRSNHGVCWNKNRCLLSLEMMHCDPIVLIEDDAFPIQDGWDYEWREALALHGHVSYAHDKIAAYITGGDGSPSRPYINSRATAQVSGISAQVLSEVGYFDSRFTGYGVGHAEWTTRIKRAGYGYAETILEDGKVEKANLYIAGGIKANDAPSFRDNKSVKRNNRLFKEIKKDPIYRLPWRSEHEKNILIGELVEAGVKCKRIGELETQSKNCGCT